MVATILYLTLIPFAIFQGWFDAVAYSRKGADAYRWDVHLISLGLRLSHAFVFFIPKLFDCRLHIKVMIFAYVIYLLSFPFFHNGFYYWGRKNIDRAYLGFSSDSTSTTSRVYFNWPFRLGLFLFSIFLLVIYEIANYRE